LIESPRNCTFTGYIDDIRGAFAAGDIFCFPTHEENEGIALLEAMAAGKPVLVRDIETFSWLADGEDSLKVSGRVDAFEATLSSGSKTPNSGTGSDRTRPDGARSSRSRRSRRNTSRCTRRWPE